jgi:hypothetical protein
MLTHGERLPELHADRDAGNRDPPRVSWLRLRFVQAHGHGLSCADGADGAELDHDERRRIGERVLMRAFALVLAMLAFATTNDEQQEPEWQPDPDNHAKAPRCAPIPKDDEKRDLKACKCEAAKGEEEVCDKDGNRTTEVMASCINRAHCLKGRCGCCPRD